MTLLSVALAPTSEYMQSVLVLDRDQYRKGLEVCLHVAPWRVGEERLAPMVLLSLHLEVMRILLQMRCCRSHVLLAIWKLSQSFQIQV